jgi:tRNA U54 and U55 pseudouridine synthase Pus10
MEITVTADRILSYGACCDHCLGRFFGKRGHGLSNDQRGKAVRIARSIEQNIPYEPFSGTCWNVVCSCCAVASRTEDCSSKNLSAPLPVTASIRRAPDPMLLSLRIWN